MRFLSLALLPLFLAHPAKACDAVQLIAPSYNLVTPAVSQFIAPLQLQSYAAPLQLQSYAPQIVSHQYVAAPTLAFDFGNAVVSRQAVVVRQRSAVVVRLGCVPG